MLLFIVEPVFLITGRGVVVHPDLGKNIVHLGTNFRLILAEKSTLDTKISGIAFTEFREIAIGPEVGKEDVPGGTEVWFIDSQ